MDELVYQVTKITLGQILQKACQAVHDDELKSAERELADAIAVIQRMQELKDAVLG